MEKKGSSGNEISGQSKEALKSETWQKVRKAMKEKAGKETGETQAGEPNKAFGNGAEADVAAAPNPESVKQTAKEKLEKELANDKNKDFAKPVIGFLLRRCEEDEGLAEDVIQGHKTWKKCVDYIYGRARKQATGNMAAVRDETVYEWSEDYYHKDDKAEEEKKAREAAERKKKQQERSTKAKGKSVKTESEPNKAEFLKSREEPVFKKNGKDMDGQLDMFSMMGM